MDKENPPDLPANSANLARRRDKIGKVALSIALIEARARAEWAAQYIPNGPTIRVLRGSESTGSLDLAIAMIIARTREETLTIWLARNSTSHEASIRPGVYVAGTISDTTNEYGRPTPNPSHVRREIQEHVRAIGKLVGMPQSTTEMAQEHARLGTAAHETILDNIRARSQWWASFRSDTFFEKSAARDNACKILGRNAKEGVDYEIKTLFVSGLDSQYEWVPKKPKKPKIETDDEQPWDAGSKAAAKVRPRKDKIPNHNKTPTGKHPKPSKRKRK